MTSEAPKEIWVYLRSHDEDIVSQEFIDGYPKYIREDHALAMVAGLMPIETAPDGPPGFLGLSDDGEGGYDGIEWLQGPQTKDGRWLCVNSHNYTTFRAKYWFPLPPQITKDKSDDK